ncbi:4-hydroxyacetophenone monooxygenase [Colletotrichum higginsianum IMI 349063]|uniref:4-hydroxyacetophenone monooxygenase n=2 Tax=Colletotrichum higginsianum TaxID=80884 RepID=A0A1B7XYJ7_COLHI|nr:4-hydroxyacetophenone monooxygenase [Colletotrichum higginsianum IMI 349063]OBR04836.1 4-hydroxyacetophenone monooxygenase [Colletotrichum higginsianum IMI 349063]TIC93990.1 putative sterigmatocystin biosynthesis monooxygenase stcW [Colletotrichum higginsianum]
MGDHIETATQSARTEVPSKTDGTGGVATETPSKGGLDQQTLIDRTVDSLLTPPKSIYDDFPIKLVERYIDEPRELRVAVVGAGLSGVLAGILLPAKVPGIKLSVYEKNADVGGTWFENIYPGVRCDVPAHVYQSTFDPNTQWTEEFAQGAEIRNYWQGLARKYDVYKYLQLSQRVEGLDWDDSRSVWKITIRDLKTDAIWVEEADFVLTAIGRFNAWKLPDYPGIKDFKGTLRHASNWDPSFDPRDKKVAVIGNGASGIQLTSNLHKVVSHLDHYARNKTWITASFAGDETSIEPIPIPEDLRETFRKDPEAYLRYRKENEAKYFRHFTGWLKGSAENDEARDKFRKFMNDRLTKKPDLIDALIPDFSPHCRRLTPGPGYLEAITSDKTDYIQTRIRRITATGIETEDGRHREVDAIFCATGANVDMAPPFPITANGRNLAEVWRPDGPYTYFGSATPGFPNLLFVHGPNGSGRSGTVPHNVENQITYFARILRKAAREGIRTIQPTRKAADDFTEYSDAFFATTVLAENCSSWYNSGRAGSRIHGLWPGSATLATIVQREPRWEDFEYEYVGDSGNPFLWYFGKGCTKQELDPEADVTPYLKAGGADVKDVHESWWSVP